MLVLVHGTATQKKNLLVNKPVDSMNSTVLENISRGRAKMAEDQDGEITFSPTNSSNV